MSPAASETEFKVRLPGVTTVLLTVIAPLALFAVGIAMISPHAFETMGSAKFWHHLTHDPRSYVLLAVVVWVVAATWLQFRYERLYVGKDALRYASPYGGRFRFLKVFRPDWSIPWSELQKAELQVQSLGLGKRRYTLLLQTASGQRVLEGLLYWQRVPFAPGPMAKPPSRDEAEMRRAIMNSPLVQAMRAVGVQVVERPGLVRPEVKGYDIAQDKGLKAASIALVCLLLYFLGDTFFIRPYMALENVPVLPYLIVGILGLWIGFELGKKAPRMERTLISILLAGACCAAWYPAMLRLNALTAGTDDHVYSYTQVQQGYFKPPEAGLPYIYLDNQPAYWSNFRNGSTHDFHVVKGALGFHEVDTGRVQDEVQAWWATQKFK